MHCLFSVLPVVNETQRLREDAEGDMRRGARTVPEKLKNFFC